MTFTGAADDDDDVAAVRSGHPTHEKTWMRTSYVPSILAPSFLKEARSLVKVCYEQKDYASKNTFIPASQGSGRSHLCILTFV